MEYLRWPFFVAIGFLSLVPVIRLYQYKSYKRYKYLRYFATGIFVWTILSFLIHLMENMQIVYFISLLVYPNLFLTSYFGLETIQSFVNKKTPKIIQISAIGFFVVNFIIAITNPFHYLFIKLGPSDASTKVELFASESGLFFYIHTYVSYLIILVVILKLLFHLRKPTENTPTIVPFFLVLSSIIIGFTFNIIHVFFYQFYIDPTYLFFVVFTFFLYIIIFRKDFRFALLSSSRKVLINSLREMYIISDEFGNIVEYSADLPKKFTFTSEELERLDLLMAALHQQAILYKTFELVKDDPFQKDKTYLYTVNKEFKIPGFKPKGTLILLYNETRLMALVDSLNYLRNFDQMTHLYNRNYIEENIDNFEETFPNFGIITLDLNGLKLTNDYLGHKAGDQLLIKFSSTLSNLFKEEKMTITRFGGDEFIIIDHHSNLKRLQEIKEKILKAIHHKDIEKTISASIGVAIRNANESFEAVLKRADKDLYIMKKETTPVYQEALLKYLKSK
ncbi:diguanylate cyclase domain-containing protein [Liberiplasma polymorphum]|uniref:GGDEF domain-containing protein n=1 Tax=Liberiplasma polymorphum TaxID=3374570 RepID=UPI003770C66E